MSIAARLVGAIWLAALVVTGGFTYFQVSEERRRLFDDMERRASVLGEGLKEAAEPAFVEYQQQIVANARRLASVLSAKGFRLVSGGTDNHLILVDVFSRGLTGKAAEAALGKAGITVNKNAIPFDPNPPMVASGVRIGTPAVTTRGMGEREMEAIGELIARVLASPEDDAVLGMVRNEVEKMCRMFPLYSDGV